MQLSPPFFRQRRFEFRISCLQLKMTSLCFKPSWLSWDKWPLHFVRTQGMCSAKVEQNSHGNIANCKIYKAYLNKFLFFFIVMKTRSSFFPNILHQTIYNLCKICEFENIFPLSHMFTNTAKYFHSIFLKMQYPISFSYENLNFYCNCTVFSIFKVPMDMGR